MTTPTPSVPVFEKGEPGFAAKLNQLGTVLVEVVKQVQTLTSQLEALTESLDAQKTPARKAPIRKTAASE